MEEQPCECVWPSAGVSGECQRQPGLLGEERRCSRQGLLEGGRLVPEGCGVGLAKATISLRTLQGWEGHPIHTAARPLGALTRIASGPERLRCR